MTSVIDRGVWAAWDEFERSEEQPGFFQGLLAAALSSAPAQMKSLEQAMTAKDLKGVCHAAHTLASTCASLGAMELSAQLKQVENATRVSQPSLREDLMPSIRVGFQAFAREIQTEHDVRQNKAA